MNARLTQMIARPIYGMLMATTGFLSNGAVSEEQVATIEATTAGIVALIAGLLVFFGDLVIHRLSHGSWFQDPQMGGGS